MLRAVCGAIMFVRPSLAMLLVGVVTDWIDGPLARRGHPTPRGAWADLEADSLLTLGAAVAAVRRGAPQVLLVGPLARYLVPPARSHDDARCDRITGVAQMALLVAALTPLPVTWLAVPVTAARCAALLARARRGQ